MSLPPRGTGLIAGTARAERGLGTPLSEAERAMRHQVVALVVKSYPIPPFTATIPLLGGCSGWIGKSKLITWDPLKTTVTSSRLVIKAHAKNDPIDFNVKFNGIDVKSFFWGEGTRCTEQTDIIDVQIVNGANLLEVDACKHIPWIGVASVDVDAYIEVNFEGEVPEEDWWEYFWQWLETNWPWLAIGTGLVIIGASVYMYVARPRGS